jgi:hypothetical protein
VLRLPSLAVSFALLSRQPTHNLVVVLVGVGASSRAFSMTALDCSAWVSLVFFLGMLLSARPIRPLLLVPLIKYRKLSAGRPGRAAGTLCGELNAGMFHVKQFSVQKPKNLGYGRATP